MRRHVLSCVACVVTACVSAPVVHPALTAPEWTVRGSGRCPNLPESGVVPSNLCGVGRTSGITSPRLGLLDAGAKARGELAAVLKAKQKTITRERPWKRGDPSSADDRQRFLAGFEEVVSRTVEASTVRLTFHDEASQTFFALATVAPESFRKARSDVADDPALSGTVKDELHRRADEILSEWDRSEGPPP